MFTISASIPEGGFDKAIVCCFDPTIVIARLRDAFPEVEIIPQDFAWRDYDTFKQHGLSEGAMRIAANDARRRGPIWRFRLPVAGGPPLPGRAERYDVTLFSEEPIPEPLRSRFLAFLEGLRFAPCVEIQSVQCVDNDEFPA
jgi:hypothetical protein